MIKEKNLSPNVDILSSVFTLITSFINRSNFDI